MNSTLDGAVTLRDWGVIRAQGEDAAKFLHGQLTQDFALLGPDQARLAAYCSAKGRMLASLIGFKQAVDDILLLCPRDVLAPTLKRLSMFVLRAKVTLSDATDQWSVFGLLGAPASGADAKPLAPWSRAVRGAGSVIALYPARGVARALWVAPRTDAPPELASVTLEQWRLAEVHSGVAMVTAPVVEAFVPQMLNYESVGGVNFKKGCYPGQEVVARSQFRGTLKRRSFGVHAEVELPVGSAVFHTADSEQPCGTVVMGAATPEGGFDGLVSMQVNAAEGGSLHLGSASGPRLTLWPLPYELLADV